jgi:hypothetical protein
MEVESRKFGGSYCWLIPKAIVRRFRKNVENKENFYLPVTNEREIKTI